jgi:hypothetical protein
MCRKKSSRCLRPAGIESLLGGLPDEMALFCSSIHAAISIVSSCRSRIYRLRNKVMHLVLTIMKPSPPSRGAKYRVDNGRRKILPFCMNQTVTLFMRFRSSSLVGKTCV